MTTEPQRIAADLTDDTDMVAAGILVAICDDDGVEVQREDIGYVRELERLGCLKEGRVTPLGARVGIVLRSQMGLRPNPGDPG